MARKLYMVKAEHLMAELIATYYVEHGHPPEELRVIKSAMTRAFNTVRQDINTKLTDKLKYKWRPSSSIKDHPDYKQALSDIMAEMTESLE
ncbi:hypothetical protein NCTGTJJY_CDS0072 [Serratia phage 92A1]|nr:hypothetical protein NCTGTJJY_CDS0072 [Serratia phage 92A1]